MTPVPPVDTSASTMDLGRDSDPEDPISVSTTVDAVEQPEDCSAEVFEDMTHHLEQLAEDNPQDDVFEKVKSHGWTMESFSLKLNGRWVRLHPPLYPC